MIERLRTRLPALTPHQFAIVAGVFIVTSIGAICLAYWFNRRNRRRGCEVVR